MTPRLRCHTGKINGSDGAWSFLVTSEKFKISHECIIIIIIHLLLSYCVAFIKQTEASTLNDQLSQKVSFVLVISVKNPNALWGIELKVAVDI